MRLLSIDFTAPVRGVRNDTFVRGFNAETDKVTITRDGDFVRVSCFVQDNVTRGFDPQVVRLYNWAIVATAEPMQETKAPLKK